MSVKPALSITFKLLRISLFSAVLVGLFMHGQYAQTDTEMPQKLFGTVEFPVPGNQSLEKWDGILAKIENEKSYYAACDENKDNCQDANMRYWREFIAEQQGQELETLISEVNAFANKWPYRTDQKVWGKSDYWAAPMEFMANSGDCEDYAIFKYMTLRALGVDAQQMRLVVVQDTVRRQAHAVLAVYTPNNIMIMDSLFKKALPHNKVLQYSPYYSVNELERWMHIKPIAAQ